MKQIDTHLAALDLNLITALNALLENQSVSMAAYSVGRTQSAMSHSLSRLRDHFRDPILVRDGWAMRLTPFAEELRPRAAAAAHSAQQLFATSYDFNPATTTQRIRIAAPDLCTSLFTGLISELSGSAPLASVEFVEGSMARQAVINAEADVGLCFGYPKSDPNLVLQEIKPLDWCTFAPTGHEYGFNKTQAVWCASRHVVVGQGGVNEGPVERTLRKLGVERHVVCYAPNFSAALNLAAETDALFTTLRSPFERTARRQGVEANPLPFDMPDAPATLIFRADYGDPFTIWLRKECLRALK